MQSLIEIGAVSAGARVAAATRHPLSTRRVRGSLRCRSSTRSARARCGARRRPRARFTGAPIDRQDGFIHFSTAAQVAETAGAPFRRTGRPAARRRRGRARWGPRLRYEPSRGGDLFPHLYGDAAARRGACGGRRCRWARTGATPSRPGSCRHDRRRLPACAAPAPPARCRARARPDAARAGAAARRGTPRRTIRASRVDAARPALSEPGRPRGGLRQGRARARTRCSASASASSRSAGSCRGRSPAIRGRGCSASPPTGR